LETVRYCAEEALVTGLKPGVNERAFKANLDK
jgi:hypothetical protein